MAGGWQSARIFALGHSTRPLEETVGWLRSFGIATVADIRTVPRSRRNPQYEQASLRLELPRAGLRYVHLPALGGLRRGLGARSPNAAWRNASFRGYADHMQTPEFAAGLEELRALADAGPVALMCAEAVPWRCHRSLVADALAARGCVVRHMTGPGRAAAHRLTPFARLDGARVTYPPQADGPSPTAG